MLCVLTTDADLSAAELDAALRSATAVTFDRLDTDGCMSTNDTVLLLASGASGVTPDTGTSPRAHRGLRRPGPPAPARRRGRLQDDHDRGGRRGQRGRRGDRRPRRRPRNNLLKCALGGEDPNWGRVLAAVGTTDAVFEPDRLNVAINGIWVCRAAPPATTAPRSTCRGRDVTITVDLSAGPARRHILTTDLTAAYVHENSAYST
jgi:glutamate N-acetyltransferase/amino-acid N-acetyltransferase